jgi:hypothetical protein
LGFGVGIRRRGRTGGEEIRRSFFDHEDMYTALRQRQCFSTGCPEQMTRDELAGVIEAAHELRLKVTGQLCAVTISEAVDLGIDSIEHVRGSGFFRPVAE